VLGFPRMVVIQLFGVDDGDVGDAVLGQQLFAPATTSSDNSVRRARASLIGTTSRALKVMT